MQEIINNNGRVVAFRNKVIFVNSKPVYYSVYGYEKVLKLYKIDIRRNISSLVVSDIHSMELYDFFVHEFSEQHVKVSGSDIVNNITYCPAGYCCSRSNTYFRRKHFLIYLPFKMVKSYVRHINKTLYTLFVDDILNNDYVLDLVYSYIKKYCAVPILKEWIRYCYSNTMRDSNVFRISSAAHYHSDEIDEENDICAIILTVEDNALRNRISHGLQKKEISICGKNEVSQKASTVRNLTDYLSLYSNQLIDKATKIFKPLFNPNTDPFTDREEDYFQFSEYYGRLKLFTTQKNVIAATSRHLKKNRSAFICGEMGCGKTAIGIATTYVAAKTEKDINIVMCPGHLVEKWKREIERLYPNARGFIIKDIQSLQKLEPYLKDPNRENPVFLVISKDTSKTCYTSRPSIKYDKKTKCLFCPSCNENIAFNRHVEGKGSRKMPYNAYNGSLKTKYKYYYRLDFWSVFLDKYAWNSKCPHCGTHLWVATHNKEKTDWIKFPNAGWIHKDMIDDIKAIKNEGNEGRVQNKSDFKKVHKEILIAEEYGMSNNYAPKRYSIVKYIHNKLKNMIEFFIADEAHAYSSAESLQANAFGILSRTANKTLALTGTLLNGYADSIYNILYRMYPASFVKEGYKYNTPSDFITKYGVVRRTRITKQIPGSWRSDVKTVTKVLPGISPFLFTTLLIDKTIFISLADMSSALPKYTETPVGISMDMNLLTGYQDATRKLTEIINSTDVSNKSNNEVLKTIQKLNIYADQPFDIAPVKNKNGDNAIEFMNCYKNKEKDNYISNKDIAVLEITKRKIEKGENVLIYVNFVNAINSIERLESMFKEEGIKYCTLTTKTSSKEREQWIDQKIKSGHRVLICNPTLVETGLDLLAFTNIIFYQVGYNLFTMRQASRRSLRLNQINDVNVYFMYYKDTVQETILSLMANKLQAAMAIEGKFTEEGLNALSNNDSILTQVANSLVNNIQYRIEEGSFDFTGAAPEEEDGSRFKLIHILEERNKRKIYSLFSPTNRKPKNAVLQALAI